MIPSVVLFEPRIPPNTGNVARTCAATGAALHLVEPLGFSIEDRYLRRAGLDYWKHLHLFVHPDWPMFLAAIEARSEHPDGPLITAVETIGTRPYTEIPLHPELYLVFGPETGSLPQALLASCAKPHYRIPMLGDRRSLNLGNSAALVLYDQLARRGFPELA